jgi:hypothetical protein
MKKLLLVLGFIFTVTAVSAISICKGTGGLDPFPADKTFILNIATDDREFDFNISAAGDFRVDWGDGTGVKNITRYNYESATYSHTYQTPGNYTVRFSGLAMGYSEYNIAAISFGNSASKILGIDGNLGRIFPILNSTPNGAPTFVASFSNIEGITSIPAGLFAGINGAPVPHMFMATFNGCTGLTSIPSGLFSGITGAPAEGMFSATFNFCTGLTSIPSDLFAGIVGVPAKGMFTTTFQGCSKLTSIPSNLFAGISGAPAADMFYRTFQGCKGLTSIPVGLFGNLSGAAQRGMFDSTFYGCTGLTGQSALMSNGTTHLYQQWTGLTDNEVRDMYYGATGLADYASIPAAWK